MSGDHHRVAAAPPEAEGIATSATAAAREGARGQARARPGAPEHAAGPEAEPRSITERGSASGERVRLSLELSPRLYALLTELAEETHSSKADVLRRALGLMQVAVEGRKRGQRLGLADKDQPLATEIVGLGL